MKHAYLWVPWFRELAEKIAQGGEAYLADRVRERRVDWGKEDHALRVYGGEKGENIDPFSFFYSLAQKNSASFFDLVYGSVHKAFELSSEIPSRENEKACTFPPSSFRGQTCFFNGKAKDFHPEVLWRLFRQAVDTDADETKIDPRDFEEVLDIRHVGVRKVTQTLFLVNPCYFFPVDGATKGWCERVSEISIKQIENKIKSAGYDEYISIISRIKDNFPERQPYEMYFSIRQRSKDGLIGANAAR